MPKSPKPDTAAAALALANTAWRDLYGGRAPYRLPTSPALLAKYPDTPKPVLTAAVRALRERTKTQVEKREVRHAARFGPTVYPVRDRLSFAVIHAFDRAFAAAGFRQPAGQEHLETKHDNAVPMPTIETRRWRTARGRWSRLDVRRVMRVPSRWLAVQREGMANALGERTLVVHAEPVTSALWAVTYWKQGRGVGTTTAQTRIYRDPATGAWKECR
jgi:hypothetical protein